MQYIESSITNEIDTGLHAYSMYTVESRAIPSSIDGLKPGGRKLVYAMLHEFGGRKTKVAELGGGLAKYNFHHGEGSAMSAVVTLTADWNNNCPVFTGHGNFGTRLIQEAAAPRYIYASLSPDFKKYFIDTDIAPVSADPDNPEPAHYLPIIPWVLVNGVSGIAVGFATSILPRSIDTLTEEVKRYLKDPKKYLKDNKDVPPTFPQFKGKVSKGETNQWFTSGIVSYLGKTTYNITELPIGHDRESYINLLHALIDSDKIKDFEDNCSEAGFGFTVKVSLQQKVVIDADPIKYFKLSKPATENLTTLGTDGKLKIFQNVTELIAYFVDYRLNKFGEKIEFQKKNLLIDIQELKDKVKFILAVVTRKVDFRVLSKDDLLSYISNNITAEVWGKGFIQIPLYNCTLDSVESLQNKITQMESEHKELMKETSMSRYLKVLA